VVGGIVAALNWWSLYASHRDKHFHSSIPLVGTILLGAGMFLFPVTRHYFWTAIFFDYGTLVFLVAVPVLVKEVWSTTSFNLLYEYLGQTATQTVRLCLPRGDVFTIRVALHRPHGEYGLVSTGRVGTWRREGSSVTLQSNGESAL
jgi:hypothetical protein